MMQLFKAANADIATDAIRTEDENNPKGYYELEAVKGIVKNNAFLKDLDGKTIKIVAPLVTFIDLSLEYRVVFMIRDLDEVLQSQEKMLGKDQKEQQEKFRSIYTLHVEKSRQFLHANNISFIEIQRGARVGLTDDYRIERSERGFQKKFGHLPDVEITIRSSISIFYSCKG